MARKFLTPIDLSQLELQNAKIQNLSTTQINAIGSPVTGQFVFDTTLHVLKVYDGTAWAFVGGSSNGSGAPSSTPTSVGAFYFDTTNYVLYVAKGTSSSADWVYTDPRGGDSDVANLGSANSGGSSAKVAKADHVHRHTGTDHANIKLSDLGGTNGADIALNNYKITGLGTPTSATDAATKGYVDGAVAGLTWKAAVNLLVDSNISLTGSTGSLNIDGHTSLTATHNGYRLLLKGQSTASQNGIYVYSDAGAGYTLSRADDADVYTELKGASVFVEEGTVYGKTSWVQSNHYLTDFSGQVWTQFSGAGTYLGGAGLTVTGNTFDVGTASTSRIVVNADNIDLATVSQSNSSGSATDTFVTAVTVDSYGRVTGKTTAVVQDASTGTKGIASFASGTFTVTSGAVDVKTGGIANNQLANSSITVTAGTNISVSSSPVSLGGSVTIGITGQIAVANGGTGASTASGARTNLSSTSSPLPQKYTETNGALTPSGGQVTWTVSHGLGSRAVAVQVYDSSTYTQIEVDVTRTDTSTVTLSWVSASSVSSGAYTVVVLG